MKNPKLLTITSPEALDAAVADVVGLKITRTKLTAAKDEKLALVEKMHQADITAVDEKISATETIIKEYCIANRASLFPDKKSRETGLAEFGFEITPPRVETSNKRIKWKDVLERLQRLVWGDAYLRFSEPKIDKEALLADRARFTPDQLADAGIQFCQDEQFFIRPKPETAQE